MGGALTPDVTWPSNSPARCEGVPGPPPRAPPPTLAMRCRARGARARDLANAWERMGAARGAPWERRRSFGRAWGPCGPVNLPWRTRGLPGSACRYVETGHTLNVKPCGAHQGSASDWASLNTSATVQIPCYHATPHRMPVDYGQACRYVETGLTPNPRAHAAAIGHSGVLATTRPH